MLDRTIAYGLDFVFPQGDSAIGESLAVHGEFSRPIVDFLIDHAVAPTGTLVDVGSNVGAICLPFAKARPGWNVLAVEAHRGLAALCGANAVNNRLSNVEVVQAAAGAEKGVVQFPNTPLTGRANFGALGLDAEAETTAPTLMLTLEDLAPSDTRLVKIDVEGADAAVLRGAGRLLKDIRPVWIVEATPASGQNARDVKTILLDAGYSLYWFWAPFVSAQGLKGRQPENITTGDVNVVALPPGVAPGWEMRPVRSADEPSPGDVGDYPYLVRYGYPGG